MLGRYRFFLVRCPLSYRSNYFSGLNRCRSVYFGITTLVIFPPLLSGVSTLSQVKTIADWCNLLLVCHIQFLYFVLENSLTQLGALSGGIIVYFLVPCPGVKSSPPFLEVPIWTFYFSCLSAKFRQVIHHGGPRFAEFLSPLKSMSRRRLNYTKFSSTTEPVSSAPGHSVSRKTYGCRTRSAWTFVKFVRYKSFSRSCAVILKQRSPLRR